MRIVVHIGAGKTGSSSIQEALEQAGDLLSIKGVYYLGLMLENAPQLEESHWQFRGGSDIFFENDGEDKKVQQVNDILLKAISRASDDGINTLIWSNEWMFGRHVAVVPALKQIESQGHEIEIICYVRRHDKWARSAYTQWGIKHKTYKGPIKSYQEWEAERDFAYVPALRPWVSAFQQSVTIVNYDAMVDVTSDFFKRFGLDAPPVKTANKAPLNSVLAAWAVFNNRFPEIVNPSSFETMLSSNGIEDFEAIMLPSLEHLVPSADDLQRTNRKYEDDIAQVNEWLRQCDQPPLDFSSAPNFEMSADLWETDQITLNLLFATMERLRKVERELREIKQNGVDPN